MKCKQCGFTKFGMDDESNKFCRRCGALSPVVWKRSSRFYAG